MNKQYSFALVLASSVLLAACSGDSGETGTPSAVEPAADQPAHTETIAEPAVFLSAAIETSALPAPGNATVLLAGVTYLFDELTECGIERDGAVEMFKAAGKGMLDDGRESRFEISRRVNSSATIPSGDHHERDFASISVQMQQPGEEFAHMWMFVQAGSRRSQPGDSIWREHQTDNPLPFVHVRESAGAAAATASVEMIRIAGQLRAHQEVDLDTVIGQGRAEFAVNCGN